MRHCVRLTLIEFLHSQLIEARVLQVYDSANTRLQPGGYFAISCPLINTLASVNTVNLQLGFLRPLSKIAPYAGHKDKNRFVGEKGASVPNAVSFPCWIDEHLHYENNQMFRRLGNDTGWSQPSSPLNSMEYANGTEKDELLMGNAWNSLWGYSRCQHCMYSQQSMVLACILRMLCSSVIC